MASKRMSTDSSNEDKTPAIKDNGMYLFMTDVNDASCMSAIEWIMVENLRKKRSESLTLYINSGGGAVDAAFALIDMMKGSSIPVNTVGLGCVASASLSIFITGKHRVLTPNTSILAHQFSWWSGGKEHELMGKIKEFKLTSTRIMNHYKKYTGLTEVEVKEHLLPPTDKWLSAKEALNLGLCDEIKLM